MRKGLIEQWLIPDQIRKRLVDRMMIRSLIESAKDNMKIVKIIPLNEQSATLVFRDSYESIRQLGDAYWWLQGYEPRNHDVSLESLKDVDIKDKTKLGHLDRFRRTRNDINYRGFKATLNQAREILEFWDEFSAEIILELENKLK